MNKILDKFGIYDLIAVLLSGISICTFSILVLRFVYDIKISIGTKINESVSFLVLSYFLGLIFQECSSLIYNKIIHKGNALLIKALKSSDYSNILLTQNEKNGVYDYVKSKYGLENDNEVYNFCKFYIITKFDTTKIDKEQSLSAMSRSLSLYFIMLAFISLITTIRSPNYLNVVLLFVSILFSVLLYYRYLKFAKLRYIYIFRTFYYNVVLGNENI